jgi:hypothetical protein
MMSLSKSVAIDARVPQQSHRIRSSPRQAPLASDEGARTLGAARTVIEGIEATQMIKQRQILGIPSAQPARIFGALLGLQVTLEPPLRYS